jgi:tetratricopeptide (TPR) repeat protein
MSLAAPMSFRKLAASAAMALMLGALACPIAGQAQTNPGSGPAGGRAPDKLPQTAEEKAKILNDLYAHLATADDEQAAKPVAETIERLWLYSGSDTINLLMERSAAALAAKNPDLALKVLDHVVALAPDYAEGFNRRAYVLFTQNNLESAVGDLRRALALEPNHFKALDGLFQIWREHGNKRGALRVVKQLLEIHPNWPGARQAVEELTREVEGQGI